MNIVVIDGYTVNPGDLSWQPLEELGSCTIYDRTPAELLVDRAGAADAVLTNKFLLDRPAIARLPRLRYIGVLATGYNVVDVAAARERGVTVTNVPTYGTASVAQMAFAHLLNLATQCEHHAQTVEQGRWSQTPDFCYWDRPLVELAGLTLGIVGFGRIGQATARIGRGFGMRIIACDSSIANAPDDVTFVDLDELFRQSDAVSLHCPLTPETDRLVNRARLALMKPTAYLINTSRGGLVDEAALVEALNAGRLAGAGLDVLAIEPPPADHPLLHARNCRVTPHNAWGTVAARQRLLDIAVDNLRAFIAGRMQNVVS